MKSVVATRTCLMLDVAVASARFTSVRLLLFICEFWNKILDEHADACKRVVLARTIYITK